jgi:hypothetical protein
MLRTMTQQIFKKNQGLVNLSPVFFRAQRKPEPPEKRHTSEHEFKGRFTLGVRTMKVHESPDINNPLLDLRRHFIKVHLGLKRQVWFQKLYKVF